jgi:hypothetical protein
MTLINTLTVYCKALKDRMAVRESLVTVEIMKLMTEDESDESLGECLTLYARVSLSLARALSLSLLSLSVCLARSLSKGS